MLVKQAMRIGRERLTNGDVGLEIEVEGRNLPHRVKHWNEDRDGSLRGDEAIEYVLKKPDTLAGVKLALDHLDKAYEAANSRVDDTIRAGVHVHINCQELTMVELYNFFTLWLVLENILIKYCGEYREGNLFCLRCQDAEYLLYTLVKAAKEKAFLERFHRDEVRYASMNVKALGDYGSLEFRAMRSTRDLGAIFDWAKILLGLRETAKRFDSPVQVIEQVSMGGRKRFIEQCLGEFAPFFNGLEDVDKLLYEGIELAQCVAYCAHWADWDKPRIIGGVEFPNDGNYYDNPLEDQ